MSLLTIIQEATDLLSLPRPDQVIGNADPQVQTLLAVANEEGRKLTRRGYWQQLETEVTFTTVLDQSEYELNTIAPGWDRQRNPTMWDRSGQNIISGPISPGEYQTNVAYLPMNVYYEWRVAGDKLVLYPPPAGDLTIGFEYVSDRWCTSNGGVLQDRWLADTDVPRLPEYLFPLGIEWRFNMRSGLADKWPEQKREYDREVAIQISQGVQMRAIDLGGQDLFRQRRVPWGNWTDYSY